MLSETHGTVEDDLTRVTQQWITTVKVDKEMMKNSKDNFKRCINNFIVVVHYCVN